MWARVPAKQPLSLLSTHLCRLVVRTRRRGAARLYELYSAASAARSGEPPFCSPRVHQANSTSGRTRAFPAPGTNFRLSAPATSREVFCRQPASAGARVSAETSWCLFPRCNPLLRAGGCLHESPGSGSGLGSLFCAHLSIFLLASVASRGKK